MQNMSLEDVLAFVKRQEGRELTPQEINYLGIAFQAGSNNQTRQDTEIQVGVLKP